MEREAWPVIMNNQMQVQRGLADTLFPMAPPQNLHEAMTHSDEIIIITNLEWANRFAHISAVKESVANNAKIASVEPGMGEWGLTIEMLHAARQRAEDAMKALEGVEKVRVTSPKGTDFTVTIKGRPPLALAQWLLYGYVVSRLLHSGAYITGQIHEVRATFWTVGSVILIYMTGAVLWAATRG